MRIVTVLGTRPEIIRLSRIIDKLDRLADHTLVHTGQNFDPSLSSVFFQELGVRAPDVTLGTPYRIGNPAVSGDAIAPLDPSPWAEQIGSIIAGIEPVLRNAKPDRLLVLGDTNSGLSAFVAKRMGIPVYHMEAGNRCYDDRVPEEVNRRVIDHASDILMPYTERSRANLVREGIAADRIYVTGNPIFEVMDHYAEQIETSTALTRLGVEPGQYFLVTMHRAENVDVEPRLRQLTSALERLQKEYCLPVIVSTHPRTRSRLIEFGLSQIEPGKMDRNSNIRFLDPLGFFDFIALEKSARCVLSDSGTVQEECCIMRVPNVTLRDVTERPETLECGSNILSGVDPKRIIACVRTVLEQRPMWPIPAEYLAPQVSDTVLKLLLGYRSTTPRC